MASTLSTVMSLSSLAASRTQRLMARKNPFHVKDMTPTMIAHANAVSSGHHTMGLKTEELDSDLTNGRSTTQSRLRSLSSASGSSSASSSSFSLEASAYTLPYSTASFNQYCDPEPALSNEAKIYSLNGAFTELYNMIGNSSNTYEQWGLDALQWSIMTVIISIFLI
jgi:hypothetical protein